MIKLPNKAAEKEIINEANQYNEILFKASKYVGSLEDFLFLLENPTKYAQYRINEINPKAEELGLSLLKLCELYEIPLSTYQTIQKEASESPFAEFVEYQNERLQVNPDKLKEYIELNSKITLTPIQELAYKGAQKAAKAMNDTNQKLRGKGVFIPLQNLIRADHAGNWSVNELHILQTLSRRL